MPESKRLLVPQQLCVGLFVQLDLGWWEHDFAFSSFKIKDQAQLDALLALGLPQVRYDPLKSDCLPLPHPDDLPPVIVEEPPPPPAPPTEEEVAAQVRAVKLSKLRKRLAEVDRKFLHTSQMVKELTHTLHRAPEDVVKQAGEVVRELVGTMMAEDGVVLHSINGKAAEAAYSHALNVTVLSMMLGRQLGYDSEACHSLGLGALMHDMGKMDVPSKVLLKTEPLNRPEQQFFQMHTEFGRKRGHKLMLDDEVLRIIAEHHEYCDGSGYPNGLHEAAIGRLSRVVCITNHFDNLCNPHNHRDALSPHEALARMFNQHKERFDQVALKAFIRCMGVYPPGSLVQLQDGRFGLVLGMHPTLPLKPTLIVYEPNIPKSEALIINLEHEPELAIAKSVRASELGEAAREYLNPRQQVSYFVDPKRPKG